MQVVEDLVRGGVEDGQPQWRIFCTGHSLGGALATLSAYELAERRHDPVGL